MPWGKMDDKFHRNRKVKALRRKKGGRTALGVWAYWWSWCLDDSELTGVVPVEELEGEDAKAADLLVEVGLWDIVPEGYRFHDFDEYNPSKQQVEAKREADRKRAADRRAAEKLANPSRVAADSDAILSGICSESHPRARTGMGGEGLGSLAPDPDPELEAFPTTSATRWQLLDRAYQGAYQRTHAGKTCAKSPKYAEHMRTVVDWSIENRLTDEQCRAVVMAFFCDRDPKVADGDGWIGYMVPRLADYVAGKPRGGAKSNGEIIADQSAVHLKRIERELADADRDAPSAAEIRALTAGIGRKIAP